MRLKSATSAISTPTPMFRKKIRLVMTGAAVGAFTLCVIVGAIVRANNGGASSKRFEAAHTVSTPASVPDVVSRVPGAATAPPQDDDTQVKLVTITSGGFEPVELLVTQKSFLLAIENRSRLDEVSLRLSQADSSNLAATSLSRVRLQWNHLFTLPQGEYLLTEDAHPDWVCKITVKPR